MAPTAGSLPALEGKPGDGVLARQGTVQFLVFELEGQRYGVDVAQIEAIVQASALSKDGETWRYGGESVTVDSLACWLGLGAAGAPRHLLLSRSAGALKGLLVEMPRDIISVPLERIHPLPPMIRHLLVRSALWGVGRGEEGLVLLVDPARRSDAAPDLRPGARPASGGEREAEEEL